MLEIAKNGKHISIPKGAYKVYASSGWKKADEVDNEDVVTEEVVVMAEETKEVPDVKITNEDINVKSEDSDDSDDDADWDEDEELDEKPLSEMKFDELKTLAAQKGLKFGKNVSTKELRELIANNK